MGATWLTYLLLDPAAPGLNPEICSAKEIVHVTEVNQYRKVNSGLKIFNENNLILASGKLVLQ